MMVNAIVFKACVKKHTMRILFALSQVVSYTEFTMHESKVAEYVYEIVEETVKEDPDLQNRKITQLVFKLSKPYTVYPDSFCFYFEELIKGTFLEGAALEFEEFGENESQKGFYLASIEVEDPE